MPHSPSSQPLGLEPSQVLAIERPTEGETDTEHSHHHVSRLSGADKYCCRRKGGDKIIEDNKGQCAIFQVLIRSSHPSQVSTFQHYLHSTRKSFIFIHQSYLFHIFFQPRGFFFLFLNLDFYEIESQQQTIFPTAFSLMSFTLSMNASFQSKPIDSGRLWR